MEKGLDVCMATKLAIKNLLKTFGNKTVLNNISFDVNEGEFLSILGPSGCGKTTLLRILIGIDWADEGVIEKDGKILRRRSLRSAVWGSCFRIMRCSRT